MGYKVGIPIKGLAFQKGKNAKHTASLYGFLEEMMDERISKSQTLDRTLSHLNTYFQQEHSGQAIGDAIYQECQEYNEMRHSNGQRALKKDAVVAVSYVVKPPAEIVNSWTDAYRKQFFEDAQKVLDEIGHEFPECSAFKEENLRARAGHFDEGGYHEHKVGMAYTDDGRIAGSGLSAKKTKATINREFPKRMRALGHEVEDCNMYDKEEYARLKEEDPQKAEEYVQAHKAKNNKGGRSVNKYLDDKAKENYKESLEALETSMAFESEQIERAMKAAEDERKAREDEVSAKAEEQIAKQNRDEYIDSMDNMAKLFSEGMKERKSKAAELDQSNKEAEEQLAKKQSQVEAIDEREKNVAEREKAADDYANELAKIDDADDDAFIDWLDKQTMTQSKIENTFSYQDIHGKSVTKDVLPYYGDGAKKGMLEAFQCLIRALIYTYRQIQAEKTRQVRKAQLHNQMYREKVNAIDEPTQYREQVKDLGDW